ncbi:MAG: aspartate aminotransferase family protein [Candidatus Abyssobacteria bacterium SURF_17]|uniref:Aspartate aminotransferase family protein n=1 Tax=Candidatus Abyssobacteria bacterium SURF_17 TaxID=2093361 RepID=A0A419ETJ8_9BACT|nr:MAG: aspartate aminotransferase family protein [Candidatus Abyssubacteria bacterium SURF_17]
MEYSINTKKSKRLFKRAQKVLPGGVSHNLRFSSPYPIYIKEAYGGKFRDADGNEFIDYWDGHSGLILGHNPPEIVKALRRAVPKGTHWGLVNKNEVELAELVCEIVPCAEMVRFCCSGTEATMYAVRLARGFTGKKVILKAQGGWHGSNHDLSVAVTPPYDMEESMGLLPDITRYTKAFPVNDLDAVRKLVDENRNDFAGIIIEPVVTSGGGVACKPEFLQGLREITRETGAVLIFDEVITGFRLAPGGGQEYFGITPDLCTMGKNLCAGMPIGAVAGRRDIMELASPQHSSVKNERVFMGGGTYSANPLSMIAGKIALTIYRDRKDEIYPVLERRAARLRKGIEEAMGDCGINAMAQGISSLFIVLFPYEKGIQLTSTLDVFTKTDMFKNMEFQFRMLNHGIYLVHGGGCLCTEHSDADIDQTIEATAEVAKEMV